MESIHFHELGKTITISGDDSTSNAHTPSAALVDVPSREELDVLLDHFSTFTNMEPPASHMNKIFPIMEQVLVDMIADPQQNFMARVSHGTSSETIETIIRLKDYSAIQTTEVV